MDNPTKDPLRIIPENIINTIFLMGYWPIKIKINDRLKIINDVEKFDGKTNITTKRIGNHSLKTELLKFIFFSWTFDR